MYIHAFLSLREQLYQFHVHWLCRSGQTYFPASSTDREAPFLQPDVDNSTQQPLH